MPATEFQFTPDVQSEAHKRQGGVCAICGTSIVWHYDPAHPVFPVTNATDAATQWLREADNCVILCNGCHAWTHVEGGNPSGSPTEPADFKYSHGKPKSNGRHDEWRTRMMGR